MKFHRVFTNEGNTHDLVRRLRVVLLKKFVIDRHHHFVAVLVDQAVGTIRVDRLHYERPIPFRLKLAFLLGVQDHRSSNSEH